MIAIDICFVRQVIWSDMYRELGMVCDVGELPGSRDIEVGRGRYGRMGE